MLYEMRLVGLAMDPFNNTPIVILKHRDPENLEASGEAGETKPEPLSAGISADHPGAEGKSLQDIPREDRILPIWIGESEAQAIATELLGVGVPRPMTHDLLKSMITSLGGTVRRVVVTELKDNTFYAVIDITTGDGEVLSIDARPSDAMALAIRCGAQIFVDAKVMEDTYNNEAAPKVKQDDADDFNADKWEQMVEQLSGQSVKKYQQ